jgi:acyl-CoA synthetase (AMP-forming)/AMP-acid ligase II
LTLRACVLGGEEVQAETLSRAAGSLSEYGLPLKVLTPAYGLAEAVLAVTVGALQEPPRVRNIDAVAIGHGELASPAHPSTGAAQVVSVGAPLPDVEVRIDGPGPVGEITVRSPSLASGYIEDAAATAERFVGGWLRTKDVGFLWEGELYVTGRSDDTVVVAGRNIDVRAIERVLGRHPGVRRGAVAVVTPRSPSGPQLAAYVEPTDLGLSGGDLAHELATLARTVSPVQIGDWVFLKRGRLPKTPSGKIQRYRLSRLPPGEADLIDRPAS